MPEAPTPQSVSADDIAKAVAILSRLQPGFLPFELFVQLARLSVTPVVELVPLRRQAGNTEVLLIPRPADDKFWPGELHVPGTIIRTTDADAQFTEALKRILHGELQNPRASRPVFVTTQLNRTKRGLECTVVYYCEITSEPPIGRFYDVQSLPANTMASQLSLIADAASQYHASNAV